MMEDSKFIQVSAFPGWIVGVSYGQGGGFHCWVITPELAVLNDGECYRTSQAAMASGRDLVEHSLEPGPDYGRYRGQD